MKKNILIIGAGQLGSRHLQGVLKVTSAIEVFVVDPSDDSLLIARQRAEEINHNHSVNYSSDWESFPKAFDIAIVATNSKVREKIIIRLVENYEIKYLILEKVLFPEVDAYYRVQILLKKYTVKTWVNHPRRMFSSYLQLKQKMTSAPKIFQVTGGNWGLGCNGLHFIDLFVFLASSEVKSLDTTNVDKELLSSKRDGYVEFTGTVNGVLNDGSIFHVSSLSGEPSATTITIFDAQSRYIIQETGTPAIYSMEKETNFKLEAKELNMQFQSTLTTDLVKSLFENGSCLLPSFNEACSCHIPFISQFLLSYNKATNEMHKILPIT